MSSEPEESSTWVWLLKWILAIVVIVIVINAPYNLREMASERRIAKSKRADSPLGIALVRPENDPGRFVEGALLAIQEINDRGGVKITDDQNRETTATIEAQVYSEDIDRSVRSVARRIARDTDTIAVLGHTTTERAVRAAVTYEEYGLLYLSPVASGQQAMVHGLKHIVQMGPDNSDTSGRMIEFALKKGWRKAAMLYARSQFGLALSRLVREDVQEFHLETPPATDRERLELVHEAFYGRTERHFQFLISELLEHEFDVVIVVDKLDPAEPERPIALIRQLREMGVKQPILTSHSLHSLTLWERLGDRANGVFAPTAYDFHSASAPPRMQAFMTRFQESYGAPPTEDAASAYETVMMLAAAVERGDSRIPFVLASLFSNSDGWQGLSENSYRFDSTRAIRGRNTFVEELKDGEFVPVEFQSNRSSVVKSSNRFKNLTITAPRR